MRRLLVGAIAVVAAVAGAVVLLADDGAGGSRPAYAVHRVRDAVPAREGDDYVVEHRVPSDAAAHARAMLPDGRLVLMGDTLLTVLDPVTGQQRNLQSHLYPGSRARPVVLPDGDIWLRHQGYAGGGAGDPDHFSLHGLLFDPVTGEQQEFEAPQVPRARFPAPINNMEPGVDGRLYFMTGRKLYGDGDTVTKTETVELWSFHPRDPDRVRREASSLLSFAMAGSTLVWTDPTGPGTTVRTRNLNTGEERARRLGCSALADWDHQYWPLVTSSNLVAVPCHFGYGFADLVVLDTEGELLARLEPDRGRPVLGVGDRWVVFGRNGYDTETGRLLRLEPDGLRGVAGREPEEAALAATWGNRILFPDAESAGESSRGTWAYAVMSDSVG